MIASAVKAPISILRSAAGEPPLGPSGLAFRDDQGEIFLHDNERYRSPATRLGVLELDNGNWLALPPGFHIDAPQFDSREAALRTGIARLIRKSRRYARAKEGEGTHWTEGFAGRVIEWALSLKVEKELGHPGLEDDAATDSAARARMEESEGSAESSPQLDATDPIVRSLCEAHRLRKIFPAGHTFSMTNPVINGHMVTLGTCECGAVLSYPWGAHYELMDAAIEAHWQKFDSSPDQVDGRGNPIEAEERAGASKNKRSNRARLPKEDPGAHPKTGDNRELANAALPEPALSDASCADGAGSPKSQHGAGGLSAAPDVADVSQSSRQEPAPSCPPDGAGLPFSDDDADRRQALAAVAAGQEVDWSILRGLVGDGLVYATTTQLVITEEGGAFLKQPAPIGAANEKVGGVASACSAFVMRRELDAGRLASMPEGGRSPQASVTAGETASSEAIAGTSLGSNWPGVQRAPCDSVTAGETAPNFETPSAEPSASPPKQVAEAGQIGAASASASRSAYQLAPADPAAVEGVRPDVGGHASPAFIPDFAATMAAEPSEDWPPLLRAAFDLAWREPAQVTPSLKALLDFSKVYAVGKKVERPLVRWHGGKWNLAPWIISFFPPHRVYVEPFGGGGSVLLRKPRSYAEVWNDLDDAIVNLFQVLRSSRAHELVEHLRMTPFARSEFDETSGPWPDDPVERARHLIIRAFMGFGSNAHGRSTGFRANSTRSGTTPAHDWANYADCLPAIIERVSGIVIENRDATRVMETHDSPETLHYVDPPYVWGTRGDDSPDYAHEMDDAAHAALLAFLPTLKGMVVLSGYPHPTYDDALPDWRRVEREAFADGARPRTEVLWLNPACTAALDHQHPQLFDLASFDAVNTPPLGRDGG